jgi:uncharacterized protein (TIGR02001 family)
MIKARVYVAGLALTVASAAHAGLTVTPTVVSDYDFRGISQASEDPALQLGVDYSTDSGLHLGVWGSNIDWGSSYDGDVEVDLIADYTMGSDETVKVNVGVVDYMYPGMTDQNTAEFWVTVMKSYFSGSIRYSDKWFGPKDAFYYELNGTFPVGETGFNVLAHVGYSDGEYFTGSEYTDYSIGVSKGFGNFTGTLKLVSSDALQSSTPLFSTDDRVILSISTTLPWAKE